MFIWGQFFDYYCGKKECGVCNMGPAPTFVLRGLCSLSKFDRDFAWTGEMVSGNKFSFRGFSGTQLEWNIDNMYWVLSDKYNSSIKAILNTTDDPYPFGTHTWYVFNDVGCLNKDNTLMENAYKIDLSFSTCRSNAFNCDDGTWFVFSHNMKN